MTRVLYLILLCFGTLFGLGAFFLLAGLLRLPTSASTKAVLTVTSRGKSQKGSINAVLFDMAARLSPLVHLDGYKRKKLEAQLKSAEIKMSPETYIAAAWVKAGLIALLIIPALLIFPILAPVIVFLAVAVYFKEQKRADEIVQQRREEIEAELPRFVNTIEQELRASRDVLNIMKSYQRNAGHAMKRELEITIADMASGNEENALTRMESRIGSMMAMTAHEAALYDNQAGGSLRKTMTSLTHKNLPLAMFLEYADMGFPAYTGATNKTCSNDTIITYLGMGIVWFTDPPEQPEPTDYDYEYRVDTDVITPVTLYAGSEINPDSPATVSFSINGSTYRMNNIVIPSGDSQIAWVKWHTPSEPQDITIYVSTNKGSLSQSTIHAKVVDLSGNDPPDPKATDTMGSWSASSVPSRETKTYAAWSVWWAKWHPYWVWHSTGKNTGYWVDDGWYDYFRDNYSASMTATTRIEPDEKVPTASGDLMKSGYGVTNTVTATVSTSAPLSHYTYGQTAVSYFPEFGYGTYWRLLERLTSGTTARFQFAKNIYSTYNQRVHFSPVWFPDGSYTVNTHVMDIWTPAGMLAMNLTDDVTISGSLYDDWHIAPGNP